MRLLTRHITTAILALMILPATGISGETQPKTSATRRPVQRTVSARVLRSYLDRLTGDPAYRSSIIGCSIVPADGGKVLYDRNGGKLFHPASTLKLFTGAAVCSLLPSSFRFTTTMSADRAIRDSILPGNLYVSGSGDPLFGWNTLDSMASMVAARGIRKIDGDLVGNISEFDTIPWGHGWMWDDEPDPDEAFISPLTIEHNAITVIVHPDGTPGNPARIELVPPTSYCAIQNTARTSLDTLGNPVTVRRENRSNVIQIGGTIHPSSEPQEFRISIWRPDSYFLHLLKERLGSKNIAVGGTLRSDTTEGRILLAEVSTPLDSVLWRMNKFSDNLAAENLLRAIAHKTTNQPGSADAGLTLVKQCAARYGIDTAGIRLADGSGVSWYNEVSPAAMTALLTGIHRDKELFRRLYETLPVAGIDGTLIHRMKGTAAAGNARGKTGSLTGNSSLAGYVRMSDGKLLAYCIMINHYPGELKEIRNLQDKIVEYLASHCVK